MMDDYQHSGSAQGTPVHANQGCTALFPEPHETTGSRGAEKTAVRQREEVQEDRIETDWEAHGGGTQPDDDGLNAFSLTQLSTDEMFEQGIQEVLKEDFAADPTSVKQTGILVSKDEVITPQLFFVADGMNIATVGSAYRSDCDIKLEGMEQYGISNRALTVRFDATTQRLSAQSSNRGLILLRRGSQKGTEFMKEGDCFDLYMGDQLEFRAAHIKILFHEAPALMTAAASVETNTTTADASMEKNGDGMRHHQSGRTDLRRILKEKKKAQKAERKIKSGKRLRAGELKKARRLIQSVKRKPCPFQDRYGVCTDENCLFQHHDGNTSEPRKNVEGRVDKWIASRGYGFAVEEGVAKRFFVHVSKFASADDAHRLQAGTMIIFDTQQGKQLDEAVNIRLTQAG